MLMQSVKYLLLLVMSAHGIFGCCWHHMHSCDTDGDACEVEVASHEDHRHAHKHHEETEHLQGEDATPTQEPCRDDESCDEKACVFVRPSQAESQFQVVFDLALDRIVCGETQLLTAAASVSAALDRFDCLAQTTGERCARLQTWLI
jgi:hypothetical protein